MRRLAAIAVLCAAAVPGGARAARTDCAGFAPLERACLMTATATTAHVDGLLTSETFAGAAEYSITGPTGAISASCYAYPGVTTCVPSARGWFSPGDRLDVRVVVGGAGSWAFTLLH